tara:strand:+ start:1376 stop:1591 length:216 start_codon:yes stop_codon:yes gene_type:complete
MRDRSKPYTPFWWALQLKKKRYASKPNKNRCMFCGITTTKDERNLCNTCFKLGEEEFKFRNYPDSKKKRRK